LFFRFAQDVAHTNEGYCLASESTSPSFISVGRFWGDPHWPLLGDPWGRCQAWMRLHRFPLVEITTSGAASVVVIKSGRSEPSVQLFDL